MPDREFQDGETVAVYGHHVIPDGTLGVVRKRLDPLPGDEQFEYLLEWGTPLPGLSGNAALRWPMGAEFCYDPNDVEAAKRIDAALDADVEAGRRIERAIDDSRVVSLAERAARSLRPVDPPLKVPTVDAVAQRVFLGSPPAGIPELGAALNLVGAAMQMAAQGNASGADHARQLIERARETLKAAEDALAAAAVVS